MNVTSTDLEQLILTRMFGSQCVTGYHPGTRVWTLRVPTASGVWASDVAKLRAIPGVEVTETGAGEVVVLDVRFTLAARVVWGS